MIPPDLYVLLRTTTPSGGVRQAEQARLVRAGRRKPESSERVLQQLLWWVGGALLSWGCALQQAGRAAEAAERGCNLCP